MLYPAELDPYSKIYSRPQLYKCLLSHCSQVKDPLNTYAGGG